MQRHSGNGWLASGFIFYAILYVILISKRKDKLKFTIFYWYLAVVIDLTLFPIPYTASALHHIQTKHQFSISLSLFTGTSNVQNLLNFFLFVPAGFLLPWSRKKWHLKQIMLALALMTLTIELIQLCTSLLKLNVRIFDVDDLAFNFIGGLFGYLLYRIARKHFTLLD